MDDKFLIDTNSFIESSQRAYRFSCFPSFWNWLKDEIHKSDGQIVIPKCVYDELKRNNDELTVWTKKQINDFYFNEMSKDEIWINFAKVMAYINNSNIYVGAGARDWSREGKADPILIAIAMTLDYKIVTFERETGQFKKFITPNGSISNEPKNPKYSTGREPKIPDVAQHFGVSCIDFYDLEGVLGLSI